MSWQFNVYSLPILLVCSLLSNFLVIAWKWRKQPTPRWYIRFLVCLLVFAFFYVLELSTSDAATMYLLNIVAMLPGVLSSALVLMFCLSYTGYEHLLTRRRQLLLMLMPILYAVFILTDGLHHQYLVSLNRIEFNGLYFLEAEIYFSPFLMLCFSYFMAVQLTSFVIIFRGMTKAPQHLRKQYIIILLALLPTLIATFIDATQANPFPYLNVHRFALCFSIIPMGWGLMRYRLLDVMPIAHDVIIGSMRDAVIILDLHERIIDVNPAAASMIRKTPHQLLGVSLEQGFTNLPALVKGLRHKYDAQEVLTIQLEEEPHFFDLRISPLHDGTGALGGCVAVLRDITDSRRAEAQAAQIKLHEIEVKMLHSFIRDASHDLKTPITVVRSSAYLLQKYVERLTQQVAQFETQMTTVAPLCDSMPALSPTLNAIRDKGENIDRSAEHLQNMIDSMLELLRLDQESAIKLLPGNLNEMIEILLPPFLAQAQKKGIELSFSPGSRAVPAAIDPIHFPHAISHLIKNALTYTPPGGSIHICTHFDDQNAVLEVRDSGIGISDDDLPNIFKRFYRANKARSMEEGGMGLGLAITHKIVETHAGSIQVKSNPNEGSVFKVILSLPQAQPSNAYAIP
jgi:PAS domain S-box-containing protein